MRRLILGPLAASPTLLVAGCLAAADGPRQRSPIDTAAPARTETATFALG
jgi:hypothetical protein